MTRRTLRKGLAQSISGFNSIKTFTNAHNLRRFLKHVERLGRQLREQLAQDRKHQRNGVRRMRRAAPNSQAGTAA
jgi:hypothetical protein